MTQLERTPSERVRRSEGGLSSQRFLAARAAAAPATTTMISTVRPQRRFSSVASEVLTASAAGCLSTMRSRVLVVAGDGTTTTALVVGVLVGVLVGAAGVASGADVRTVVGTGRVGSGSGSGTGGTVVIVGGCCGGWGAGGAVVGGGGGAVVVGTGGGVGCGWWGAPGPGTMHTETTISRLT